MGIVHNISVIVPVYNSEKTIGRCVESILAQNYVDFELFLVDDGSSDRTAAICDDYGQRDDRIRVIHQKNAGAAAARNAALLQASGEYVCFVDADDWVRPYYLENLIEGMQNGVDLVIAYPQYYYGSKVVVPKYKPLIVDNSNFEEIFIEHNIDWNTAPWAKLFKMSIIQQNGIQFPQEMKLGEDCVFLYTYMHHSKVVNIISSTDYCYNISVDGTLTKRKYEFEYEKMLLSRITAVVDELIEKKDIKNQVAIKHLWRLKNNYTKRVLDSVYFSSDMQHSERIEIVEKFRDAYKHLMFESDFQGNALKFLLKHHLFQTYDFVRMAAKRIKR